jgi:hypothetical protein
MVQYYFDKEEHEFEVTPHGNCKGGGVPFKQTTHSLRGKIAAFVQSDKSAKARQKINESMGGLLAAPSSATVPRNNKQMANYHARSASIKELHFVGKMNLGQ